MDLSWNTDIISDIDKVIVTFAVLHNRFNINRGSSRTVTDEVMFTDILAKLSIPKTDTRRDRDQDITHASLMQTNSS